MVAEALKKDRECVNNRPMYVSQCEPDKQSRASGLRFPTRLEKNKLFVKGKHIYVLLIILLFFTLFFFNFMNNLRNSSMYNVYECYVFYILINFSDLCKKKKRY